MEDSIDSDVSNYDAILENRSRKNRSYMKRCYIYVDVEKEKTRRRFLSCMSHSRGRKNVFNLSGTVVSELYS